MAWPKVKYPLDAHAQENQEAESKTLQEVEQTIKEWSVSPR